MHVMTMEKVMATTSKGDEVFTHDVGQAAFLLALRHPLRRLEWTTRKAFVFDASARADADRFYANTPVGCLDFAAALRQVKARLYGAG